MWGLQEYTNFHFDVQPSALRGALERFAQFFVAPLFTADALEREVQAVDSEFVGVQQSDHARLSQLMCHTVSPTWPGIAQQPSPPWLCFSCT